MGTTTISAVRAPGLSDGAQALLERYFSGLNTDAVRIQVGMPALRTVGTELGPMEALMRVASSYPNLIIVHPRAYEPDTAAGIALLAHELVHQAQYQQNPNLAEEYAAEQARVEALGLPPYANAFERPAYELEAQVYLEALEMGYPPGSWVPLLLQEQGAGAAGDGFPVLPAVGTLAVVLGLVALGGRR